MSPVEPRTRIGYLGPLGTYTEQALLTQPDLAAADGHPYSSIPDVLTALAEESVDVGFVPIENAIEGAVNVTQDTLAFDLSLLVQREVVLNVRLDLLALPKSKLTNIHTVTTFPVALAQCRTFLHENLPDAQLQASTSTAEAARQLSEKHDSGVAVIASPRAGDVYGLDAIATAIEDHPGNKTRFLLLSKEGIPAPTGRDKTSVVVFQRKNVPGSLLQILQEFAARGIDLTRLESRPARTNLGEYCFLLDFDGHIADEVVTDCLRNLKMKQHEVKFLGSYPIASSVGALGSSGGGDNSSGSAGGGANGGGGVVDSAIERERQAAAAARSEADDWLDRLRRGIQQ